jgi:GNAT superfamily N-acetyltransferase
MEASRFSSAEVLRDGRRVVIRAQRPGDLPGMRAALARISDESYYRRFFGPRREFSDSQAEPFLNIDFVQHVALVVEAEEQGAPAIVAGGRYVVIGEGRAEVAFVVIDGYQGLGLAGLLMRRLTEIGRSAGLSEFVAEVLAGNRPMLRVFERSGLPMRVTREAQVLHVVLKL